MERINDVWGQGSTTSHVCSKERQALRQRVGCDKRQEVTILWRRIFFPSVKVIPSQFWRNIQYSPTTYSDLLLEEAWSSSRRSWKARKKRSRPLGIDNSHNREVLGSKIGETKKSRRHRRVTCHRCFESPARIYVDLNTNKPFVLF